MYDVIVPMGYNNAPPVAGKGSAIFLHLLGVGDTAGCVAIDDETMRIFLASATPASVIDIVDPRSKV